MRVLKADNVLKADKRWDILHLLIEGSAKEAGYEITKRYLDVIVSLALLIIALPVLGAIAAVIKTTSRGPVLFRSKRLGRGGREFWCYKFRTMVPDAERQLLSHPDLQRQFFDGFKIKNDPRVTRPGAFLRKTSLDELPQLFNVLRGDMSLIGPRPMLPPELDQRIDCYGSSHGDRLLSVKPGLGGIWQVSGRSDTSYAERIAMDMDYVARRSIWLDLKLMFLTAIVVIRRRGAY